MAISYIDGSSAHGAGSTTITLPSTFSVGDLIILFSWANSTTIPTLATGYTAISAQGANSNAMRSQWKTATLADIGSTFGVTGAALAIAAIYRGASTVGGAGSSTNAASTTDTIVGIGTFTDTSGQSWAVSFSGSAQRTSMSTPSGSTLRVSEPGSAGAGGMGILVDSNAGVSSWGAHNSTLGTSAVSAGGSVELIAAAVVAASYTPIRIPNKYVGPMALRYTFRYPTPLGGYVPQAYSQSIAASVSFTGASTASTAYHHTGSLSFTGIILKRTLKALSGGMSFLGSISNNIRHFMIAALSFSGTLRRGMALLLAASLSFTGSLNRQIAKILSAALSFIGAIATVYIPAVVLYTKDLAAGISFSGSITVVTDKTLSGTLSFAGSIGRVTSKVLVASVSFLGQINKTIDKAIVASLGFTGDFLSVPVVPTVKSPNFILLADGRVAIRLSNTLYLPL